MAGPVVQVLVAVAAAYVLLVGLLYLNQRSLLFKPDAAVPAWPADAPAGLRAIRTPTEDGLSLRHWYLPPAAPGAGTVVVFHGNAGNRAGPWDKFRAIADWGHGLLLADYRGYGGNPGKPSEAGLLADARAVMDWLAGQGMPPSRVALYGESLGSGVAAAIAAERAVAGVVLEAPFTSVAELAQQQYWYVPARRLVRDRFDTRARLPDVRAPILILHGELDPTIPVTHGAALAELAGAQADFARLPQGDHLNLWEVGADTRVRPFLQRVLG